MSELSFEQQAAQAVQNSVLHYLKSGDWMKIDYGQKFTLPKDFMQRAFDAIDMEKVMKLCVQKLEIRLVDSIIGNLSTEIGSDTKRIMCNDRIREELRAVVREKLKACTT